MWKWKIINALSVIGTILAIYLLWQRFFQPAFTPCNINTIINCNAIISGEVSNIVGIPTALVGLVGYVVIFFSSIFQKKKLLLGIALFGLVFCLWIAYRELFELHVICPVCILCQLDMLSVFVLSFFLLRERR